jgi:hypothetical protein
LLHNKNEEVRAKAQRGKESSLRVEALFILNAFFAPSVFPFFAPLRETFFHPA